MLRKKKSKAVKPCSFKLLPFLTAKGDKVSLLLLCSVQLTGAEYARYLIAFSDHDRSITLGKTGKCMVNEDVLSWNARFEFHHRGAARWHHGGLHVQQRSTSGALVPNLIVDRSNCVKG